MDEQTIRRAAISAYNRFMRIKATGHQIHVYCQKHRLTPGIDWSGSSKWSMAERFAVQDRCCPISEAVVKKLEEYFGVRTE